jgi:hypothetical protein
MKSKGNFLKKESLIQKLQLKDNELIQAIEELTLNDDRLQSLVKISEKNFNNTQNLLDFVLDEAIRLTGSTIGYIYYYNESERKFTLNSWSKDVMKECLILEPQSIYELDKTGIWGEVVRQGNPIIINDFKAKNSLKKGYPDGHIELKSFLSIPVFYKNKIVAVVGVGNKKNDYNQNDIRQLTLLMNYSWRYAENLKAENQINKLNRLLTITSKINKTIVRISDFNEVLKETCRIIIKNGNFKYAWAGLLNSDLNAIELIASEGKPKGFAKKMVDKIKNDSKQTLPCSIVIETGKRFYDNINEIRKKEIDLAELLDEGFKSVISLPIIVKNKVRGIICIYSDKNEKLDEQELDLLDELALDISFSLENSDKEKEKEKLTKILTKSESRYQLLFNHNLAGIYRTTIDGQILDCNQKFANMLGYSSVQDLKKSFAQNLYFDSLARNEFIRKLRIKGVLENSECLLKTKQGEEIWILENVNLIPATETEPEIIHGTCVDITKRKLTEQSLHKAKENWQATFDAIQDIVILLDKDHHIIEINQAGIHALNQNKESILGQSCFRLVHGTNEPIQECPCEKSFKTKKSEISVYKQNDSYFELSAWPILNDKNKVEGFTHIVKDITNRIKSEEELKVKENRYRTLFDLSPSGIALLELDGTILEVNKSYCDLVLYSKEELIGKNIKIVVPKENQSNVKLHIEKIYKVGIYSHVVKNVKKDGTICHVELNETLIVLPNGSQGILTIANDITDRIFAEEQIKESERKYKALVESSKDSIFILQDGIIKFANPELSKISGYSNEELVGKPFIQFVSDDEKLRIGNYYKKRISGEKMPEKYESKLISKSGSIVIVEVVIVFIDYKGQLAEHIILRDITERKKYIDQIKKHKNELVGYFENDISSDYVADIDGEIYSCNKTFVELFGFENKKQTHKFSIIDLYKNPNDRKKIIEIILKEKKVENFEVDFITKNQKEINAILNAIGIYDDNGELIQIRGYIVDITDRKKAENELRKLSRAIDQSPESIFITDFDGRIEYINPVFSRITGYSPDEVIGKNPNIFKSGNQTEEFYKNLWDTIKSGRIWEGEFLNKKKDGDLYWEKASISPIFNENHKIINFVAVKEDITEKKRMIDELIKAKEKAEESNKLKTAFLNNISHEVRTPMNAILGFSRLLKNQSLDQDKKLRYIDTINNSGNYLLSIITDILNISLIEAEQVKQHETRTNINNLLKKIEAQFELKHEDIDLKFMSELNSTQAEIYTDETKLIQIITNLVGNSLKFTKKGYIKCTCKLDKLDLKFEVIDTGIGIPENIQKSIFDRFIQAESTIKNATGGMGLGLAIAKSYVELLGGQISVKSKLNKGSVFSFTIPYKPVIIKKSVNLVNNKDVEVKTSHATILVVEDEYVNFLLIQEYLSEFHLNIKHAENGQQAVEVALNNSDIDLVLMDIKMPIMDGFEALTKIKAVKPNLKIIAQTAYALQGDKAKIKSSNFDDYIEKPIDQIKLIELLRKYIEI